MGGDGAQQWHIGQLPNFADIIFWIECSAWSISPQPMHKTLTGLAN